MRFRRNRPDVAALRLIGLDTRFTAHQLEQLAGHTDILEVPAGEILALAGKVPRQFVAVIDGEVAITDRRGHVCVAGPGVQLGAAELVDERPHAATVTTRSDSTIVVVFGPAFRSVAADRQAEGPAASVTSPLVRRRATARFDSRVPALAD